jgi:xylan 1,4-beta-xylosidase
MSTITNPILPGFNPDPSILRVGDDYYIANSTFEWFPGVRIHHSRDLRNWELLTHPLSRVSQLDMLGNADSGGIWAPCLTYCDGVFYLIYTDVKQWTTGWMDTHNYLVTATDIRGPWSDPIYLNSSGFDPSLFHDDDGRKWLVNMVWDHRKGKNTFGGILLQEYSPSDGRLVGPIVNIFRGSSIGATEGPHLYKRNGYYYLLTAEGGTSYGHAVTMARSRSLTGPYAVDPSNPIVTARDRKDLLLQKAGHADFVETQNGEWYLVHLCARHLPDSDRCILGRETAIQRMEWTDDGWLRMASGENAPAVTLPAPALPEAPVPPVPVRDDFDALTLSVHWQTLRVPASADWLSLSERPGYLRLYGRETLSSRHRQSLLARRQQAFHYTASTCLEFNPASFQQMAGLVCFYDVRHFYYLKVSHDEELGRTLGLKCYNDHNGEEPVGEIAIPSTGPIYLRAMVDNADLQFSYGFDGNTWNDFGPVLDAGILSDEVCGGFTGAFVGLCCQDLTGRRCVADFDYLTYEER